VKESVSKKRLLNDNNNQDNSNEKKHKKGANFQRNTLAVVFILNDWALSYRRRCCDWVLPPFEKTATLQK
jgi:hypothetical protein